MLPKFTEILCAGLMLCKAGTLCALEPTQTGMPAGQMHAQTRALLATKKTNFQAPTALAQERVKSQAALNPKRVSIPHFGWIGAAPGAIEIYRRQPTDRVARRSALFLHGGGFTFGSTAATAPLIGALSDGLSSCIYSFDYPLAPEHRFPAALDQAMAVWRYLSALPAAGGCPALDSIIGESAGGNLAAALSLAWRKKPNQPHNQILLYPMLDARGDTPSWRQYAHSPALSAAQARWLWRNYATARQRSTSLLVSPALASRLDGMPSTLILSAENDILRDEAETFARRIASAGGDVRLLRAFGLPHGFLSAPALFGEVNDDVIAALAAQWDSMRRDQ